MDLRTERYQLMFDVRRSVRYHRRRSRFFDLWGKVTSGINILSGSAAVSAVVAKSPIAIAISGGLVAVASTIDLVASNSIRARDHADLAKRFIALEAEVERSDPSTPITPFREKRLAIEADEPPVLRALDLLCHNELVKAMGYGQLYRLGWWKRHLAQLIAFESMDMEPISMAPMKPPAAVAPPPQPPRSLPS